MPRPKKSPPWDLVHVFPKRKVWRCPFCCKEHSTDKNSLARIRTHLTSNMCPTIPVWIKEIIRREFGLDPQLLSISVPRSKKSPLWDLVNVCPDHKVWRCLFCRKEHHMDKNSLARIRRHFTGCPTIPVGIKKIVQREFRRDPPPPPQHPQLQPLASPLQLPQNQPPPPQSLPPQLQPLAPPMQLSQIQPPPPRSLPRPLQLPQPQEPQPPAPLPPPQLALAPGIGLDLAMADSEFPSLSEVSGSFENLQFEDLMRLLDDEIPPSSAQERGCHQPSSRKDIAGSSRENDGF